MDQYAMADERDTELWCLAIFQFIVLNPSSSSSTGKPKCV